MIQTIDLNEELVGEVRKEFEHCESLFTEIHSGIEIELKQRLHNLELHKEG